MKRIILEYFFILFFESFNGMNGKLILLFWNLSGNEWNEQEGTLIIIFLKNNFFKNYYIS